MKMSRKKEYILYKGDEIIGTGTIEELAKTFNVKCQTIRMYNTPAYRHRSVNSTNARRLIALDDYEEEDVI